MTALNEIKEHCERIASPVLVNSGFQGVAVGDFLDKTQHTETGSTVENRVWYGTNRPGRAVGGTIEPISYYDAEGLAFAVLLTERTETSLESERVRLLNEVDDLLALGRYAKARSLYESLPLGFSMSSDEKRLARVFLRPNGRSLGVATGLPSNSEWLRRNASDYEGQWVALRGNQFVDSDPQYRQLKERLVASDQLAGVQIIRL